MKEDDLNNLPLALAKSDGEQHPPSFEESWYCLPPEVKMYNENNKLFFLKPCKQNHIKIGLAAAKASDIIWEGRTCTRALCVHGYTVQSFYLSF